MCVVATVHAHGQNLEWKFVQEKMLVPNNILLQILYTYNINPIILCYLLTPKMYNILGVPKILDAKAW